MSEHGTPPTRAKLRTISGLVATVDTADEQDELDELTTLVILSDEDDERYLVEMNRKGRELIEYVDLEVEVTGVVQETSDGPVITVKSFEELEPPEDWDDDDGWNINDERRRRPRSLDRDELR